MNRIPTVTKNLLIINVLMFFATIVLSRSGVDLEQWLGLHFFKANHFYPWQFVTYMFLHGNLTHLFFNMFALWMFGSVMERVWGAKRFVIFLLVCGIGAGLVQEVVQLVKYAGDESLHSVLIPVNFRGSTVFAPSGVYFDLWNTIGFSGAIYGILLAFGLTFPEQRMFVFPIPLPIPAKYFVIGYAVIELMCGFGGSRDGVAHFAHLGGMLFGWLLILYWRGKLRMPHFSNPFKRRTWNTIINEQPIEGFDDPDEDWNARKRKREAEIDRILDKVRKHGYGALSESEKRTLFNAGK